MRTEVVVHLARPLREVFERVVDDLATTLPQICALTTEVRLDEGTRIGPGTRGQMRLRTSTLTTTLVDFRVIDYVQDVVMSMEAGRGNRVAFGEYRFADDGNGTSVRMITSAEDRGPRWLQSLKRRALQRHDERDGRRLKAILEGKIAPAPAARSPLKAILIYILLAAIVAVIWASIRSLSSS